MEHEPDMRWVEAIVKTLWGTDAACQQRQQREDADKLVAEVEAKVDRLHRVLDDSPAKNLDEAIYQLTHRSEG